MTKATFIRLTLSSLLLSLAPVVYSGEEFLSIKVKATAYTPSPKENGGYSKTATGHKLGFGIIAVDPKVIPLYSKVYVPGYGYGIALDTGGAIKGNKIDLCHPSRSWCMKWGRKSVTIKVWRKKANERKS